MYVHIIYNYECDLSIEDTQYLWYMVLTVRGNGGSSLLVRLLRYQADKALQTGSGRSSKSRCCAKITSDLRRPPSLVRLIS